MMQITSPCLYCLFGTILSDKKRSFLLISADQKSKRASINSSWEGTLRRFVTHCVNIFHQVITMTMMLMVLMMVSMLMVLMVITFLRRNVQNGELFTHCVNITRRPWWRYARLSQLVAIVIV